MANASSNAANAAEPTAKDLTTESANTAGNTFARKGPNTPEGVDDNLEAPASAPSAAPSPGKDSGILTDGVTSKQASDLPVQGRRIQDLKLEPKERAKTEEQKAPLAMSPSTQNTQNSQITQNVPFKPKGPYAQRNDSRSSEDRNAQPARDREADLSLKSVAKKKDSAPLGGAISSSDKKQVSGRTFEFRSGAWYDTTYRGQGTINVRRNTDDYKRLDRGLRGIAESIFGTVVTVWNGKAYRIQ